MSVALTPIQNLHGYDHPWAPGAGKNLVEETLSSATITAAGVIQTTAESYDIQIAKVKSGVTYTITSDELFVGGFFTNKPVVGSTTYDGSRIADGPKTFTAPIDGYVAFRTSGGYATPQCEEGNTATSYAPYSNVCPITGRISTSVSTTDGVDTETVSIAFGQTVYGGDQDIINGSGEEEWANIASYNGETLPGEWLSSLDAYASGTTPTTGAQVVYKTATPTELSYTADELQMLKGNNSVTGDGVITITAYTGDAWPIEEG